MSTKPNLTTTAIYVRAACVALWLMAVLIILSGCGLIAPRVGPEMAKAVNRYCASVAPAERALLREQVNAQIAPNSVMVECASDTDDEPLVVD